MAEGNFILTSAKVLPTAKPGDTIIVAQGTVKNIGDLDVGVVAIIDKDTNQTITAGRTDELDNQGEANYTIMWRMPNKPFNVRLVSGHMVNVDVFEADDFRDFTIGIPGKPPELKIATPEALGATSVGLGTTNLLLKILG